jgi:hypothetical protein
MIVAVPAGQAQVFQHITALRVNVVNLHGLPAVFFGSLAVLAATLCAFVYQPLERVP